MNTTNRNTKCYFQECNIRIAQNRRIRSDGFLSFYHTFDLWIIIILHVNLFIRHARQIRKNSKLLFSFERQQLMNRAIVAQNLNWIFFSLALQKISNKTKKKKMRNRMTSAPMIMFTLLPVFIKSFVHSIHIYCMCSAFSNVGGLQFVLCYLIWRVLYAFG